MSVVGVGNNYYSAFNPLNLGDCALWLDAADTSTLTLSGSNVTQWNDKSGNARNTTFVSGTPVLSNNVVNSKRGVYFNGSSYFRGDFSYSSNTLTWIIVGSMESGTSSYGRLLSFGNTGVNDFDNTARINACSREALTNELVSYRNVYLMRNAFITYGYPFLFSGGIDGTSNYPFLNASAVTGGATSGNFGFAQYSIANGTGTTGGLSAGHIFEIIVYTSFLSTAQRQQIEGYLADKWNLRGVLPGIRTGILPTSIYGLQLWLDGTDSTTMTLSGSNVTQWNDKSGNGRNTTAVYGTPQLKTDGGFNGLSAVYFGASAAFTGPITNGTSNLSVFVVARLNDVANPRRFFTLGASGRLDYDSASDIAVLTTGNSTSELAFYRNYTGSGYQTAIVTPVYNAPFVYSLQLGNGSGRIYRDFTTTASAGNNGVFGYTTYAVAAGFTPSLGAYLGNGYIAEILVYNTVLSENERQDLNNYFATKYARSYTPPAAHIYKSITPVTRGFAPVDIPGCTVWLDAADPNSLTLSGSNVTQWRDKSGNGTIASQATTSNQPIYQSNSMNGLPSIQFNAISRNNLVCLDTPAFDFGTSARTAFFVIRNNFVSGTVAASPHWFWPKTGNGTNALSLVGWISATVQGQAGGASTTYNRNQICLVGYRFGSTSAFEELFSNSTTVATATKTTGGSSYANATSGYRIGGLDNLDVGSSTYWFDGNIGEILLFNRALTTTERQQIEGYLARKWGLIGGGMQTITTFTPTKITGCQLWLDGADTSSMTLSYTGIASFNQYVTTSDQIVSYIGTLSSLSSFTGGTTFMNGTAINFGNGTAGVFCPSATSGVWYSADTGYTKVVKLQFTLTGTTLYIRGLSAGYNASGGVSPTNSGAVNDTAYSTYASTTIATSSTTASYGVASFTMNFTSSSATTVSQWNDKSGNRYNFTPVSGFSSPTIASNSINSNTTLSFTGSGVQGGSGNQLLTNASFPLNSSASGYSMYVVARQNASHPSYTGYNYILGVFNGSGLIYGTGPNNYLLTANGTNGPGQTYGFNDLTENVPNTLMTTTRLTSIVVSGSVLTPYLNGSAMTGKTGTVIALTGMVIGDGYSPTQNYTGQTWGGNIAEIIIFNSALSATNHQQIEGYLAMKWGLQTSLPSTHPYALRGLPSTHPFISRMPATTVFNPLQISGCALWLDAADPSTLTLSGLNVTQWNDKSGNSRHLSQATAGNRPTYSTVNQRPFVNFTAANSNFMSNTSMTIDYRTSQIFLVFQRKSAAPGNPGVFAPLTAGQSGDWPRTDGFVITTALEVASAGSGSLDNQGNNFNLTTYGFTINNNSLTTFRDFGSNSVITRSMGLTAVPNALYLGIRRDGASLNYPSDIYFGEALVYNRLLTTSEYKQLEAYLAWKWGLNGGYSPLITTSTQFTPTNISNCSLWLDAADPSTLTLSGLNVTQWNDKSSNRLIFSQTTVSNQPTIGPSLNNQQTIQFTTTQSFSSTTNLVTNPAQSWFLVFNAYNNSNNNRFWLRHAAGDLTVTGGEYFFGGNGTMWANRKSGNVSLERAFIDSVGLGTTPFNSGQWYITDVVDSNTTTDITSYLFRMNGSNRTISIYSTSSNILTGTSTSPVVINSNGPTANVYIAEVIFYNTALTTSQVQQVEGYLANKWGLTGSLSASHPYANRSLPSTHPYKLIKP